ncbi:MAG: hypothetical protein GQ570_03615 [Helicobacteraceae bacterium]|nr:hypothetical protein [Helicobacteraceae bacterium]
MQAIMKPRELCQQGQSDKSYRGTPDNNLVHDKDYMFGYNSTEYTPETHSQKASNFGFGTKPWGDN